MGKGGHLFACFHDGPGDELGEAQLSPTLQRTLLVDEVAVFFNHPDRNLALRGRGRYGQARRHIFRDAGCDTP